jgi:hypothetical protein
MTTLAGINMFVIHFFVKEGDWELFGIDGLIKYFETEQDAEDFVEKYPRFGSEYGRAIRNGNWQIVFSPD